MSNNPKKKKVTKSYSLQPTVAAELVRFADSCDETPSSALDLILVHFLNAFGKIEKSSCTADYNTAIKTNKNVWHTSNTGPEFLISFNMSFVAAPEAE